MPAAPQLQGAKPVPLLIVFLVGAVIWFLPPPEGVDPKAWHLLAIFIATIVGIMVKPLPMGAVAITGVATTVLTGTLSIEEALSGFSHRVVWLIAVAFFIARGFIKTGLGQRIAYLFMALLGKKTLGLGYGLVATDLVLAPAIPSNTARAGGVIFPILVSLARAYGSEPDDGTAPRIGAFLIITAFQGTVITGAMFLTGMAANPLAAELAANMGIQISWSSWALAAVVPGCVSLILIPLMIYLLHPPEIKQTPEAVKMANMELTKMGSMKRAEWIMLGVFIMLLTLWIFGRTFGLHTTSAALAGLAVLLITGVLTWDDICREQKAWNTLIWVAALVMMASFLNELGLIPWFSETVGRFMGDTNWVFAFVGLSLIYFYSHYFFASNTAHISSMYVPFLAVAVAAGTPPLLAALVLGFFSNLFSSMTHYGTGPAPIFFGSGYVELGAWWKLGALISVANVIIWLGLGGLWWKVLGLW
ncbi:anion permease [Acidobacteria bacterium AH-259-O06]|nr:anion permease [Acidobacteria bacterium AH-259-O06]